MPSMRLFHRRVASTDAAPSRLKGNAVAVSLSSIKTESTVATDFSDEHREDLERSLSELAFSDDEDNWRNDFLSPGTSIPNDLKGRKSKPLSPVPSEDCKESSIRTSSPAESSSESQQVTSETTLSASIDGPQQYWVEPLKPLSPQLLDEKPPAPVLASSENVRTEQHHHRHRSMTSVAAVIETPPSSERRVHSLSLTKPPTHRRSSSMTACLPKSPRSPLSACLSLEDLYSTLRMLTHSFGPCDFKVGQTWNFIGNYHFRQQEYEKAIEAYEETLKCNDGSSGTDHLAAAYGNIGTVCWSTGDIKRSIVCMKKALELRVEAEISQGRDPSKSLSVAACYHQLGLALSLKKEYAKALDAFEHTLQIRKKVLGRRSEEVARTLDAIGRCHIFRGEANKAMHCFQEAYAIKRDIAGEHGPGVIASLMNIATAHAVRKDYREAIFGCLAARSAQTVEMQRAAKEGNPSLGRMSEEAGETSQMLVDLFTKTGSFQNAQLAVSESLKLYQQAGLREEHPRMKALKESVKLLQNLRC